MLLLKPLHTLKATYIKQPKSHCSALLMVLYMTETPQQPHRAAPQLCLSSHTAGTAATSHMVHGKWAYMTFLGSFTNYQVLDGLQDQDELCNCYRGQPDPAAENIRWYSSYQYEIFLRICSVTAGITLGAGKVSVSWPRPENREQILARTAGQHQHKLHPQS